MNSKAPVTRSTSQTGFKLIKAACLLTAFVLVGYFVIAGFIHPRPYKELNVLAAVVGVVMWIFLKWTRRGSFNVVGLWPVKGATVRAIRITFMVATMASITVLVLCAGFGLDGGTKMQLELLLTRAGSWFFILGGSWFAACMALGSEVVAASEKRP